MIKSKNKYIVIALVAFVLSAIAYSFHFKFLLVAVLMLFWCYCISFSLKKLDDRITLCSFLITFFTFLLSRIFIDTLLPGFQSGYTVDAARRLSYSNEAEYFVLFSLILSLVGLSIGYLTTPDNRQAINQEENPLYIHCIRNTSKRFVFIFYAFSLLVTVEKIKYIWANGYIDYYLTYREGLPHICYTLAAAFKFAFYIYLATMPSKKEARLPIILYILEACVSLLTGQRGAFITPLLFIVIYCFIRNSLSSEDPWIGKKGKLAIYLSIPVICASMFLVMLIRGDHELGNDNFVTLFLNFFYQLGGSENIIGYAYDYQSNIPNGQWYSFGPLIRFFQDNHIAELLGHGHSIQSQSIEMATRGHELGSFLTYYTDEYRYLSGGNLASSYVAELWLDFGFVGVVVGSFIYGRILAFVRVMSGTNIWKTTIILIMVNRILTAPRSNFVLFITDCLSFSFLLMVIYMVIKCRNISHYISS